MRSSLELVLLLLVQDGLGTPYELKTKADLSLGSTVPALARLKEDGLLTASDKEARRSRRFELSSKGARTLQKDWCLHLQSTETDIESILRIAFLAWRLGSADAAASFVESSADRLGGLLMMSNAEVARFGRQNTDVKNDMLRWLRARVESGRLAAEVDQLEKLGKELRKSSPGGKTKDPKEAKQRVARTRKP